MAVASRRTAPAAKTPLLSGWRLYGLISAVGAIAYLMTGDTEPASGSASKRTVRRASSSEAASRYRQEDYTATFAPTVAGPRDAFQPLIVKKRPTVEVKTSVPKAPNVQKVDDGIIPNAMLGEPNSTGKWVYSGFAELNSQRMGLIENLTTGEAEFVLAGDPFKTTTVTTIREEFIVLRDSVGKLRTIKVTDPDKNPPPAAGGAATTRAAGASGQVGSQNMLRGPIGNPQLQPLPAVTPQETRTGEQFGGRRGRRNRN